MRLRTIIFFASFLIAGENASAYLEYSARYNINSCTACHQSPAGGGPRTTYGKLFGAHGYRINPFLVQDYVSADFRALFFYPEQARETKSGMGIMSGSVAGHVALDEQEKIHLVIEANVAGFQQAQMRDTYGLYVFSPPGKEAWFESLMIGRFRAPFGIVTDEHRTYTRIQTGTEWFSMEAGAMLSGQAPKTGLHYDLALLNGENTGGTSLSPNGAGRWGSVVNLRYMPGPAIFGGSFSYHRHDPRAESRTAASLYSVISLGRWTNGKVPVTVDLEYCRAWNWGGNLSRGFINDAGYAASVTATRSDGWLSYLYWDISQRFSLVYKFDWLTPDKNFPADYYQRHGLGFRYWFGPNASLWMRTEIAKATPPSEKGSLAMGAENATYAIVQLTF